MRSRSGVIVADDPDGQAGAGEGMTPDDLLGQAQDFADLADFVLEQFAQWLDQFEAQLLGQAADVVMQLDVGGGAGVAVAAFDHVGIERALGEETRPRRIVLASRLNASMNSLPMILRFCCGSVTPFSAREELLGGIAGRAD